MNMVLSILCMASGALSSAADAGPPDAAAGPPTVQVANDGDSSDPARDCLVYARLHVTLCTNAIDGTPSIISDSLCADGCGNTFEEAADAAYLSMSTVTCLGPAWGCCNYYIDQNFNTCGG
jgi:hypothetical protein